MKRPSFQFYAADWFKEPALRASSLASRGLWIDMIALMHQGEPYGHLVINSKPVSDRTLARMVGASHRQVSRLLNELESAGVFSRTPDGAIYSRRMVRDEKIRESRASGGKLGGNPALKVNLKDNHTPNLDANLKPTPSSSSSPSVSTSVAKPPKPPLKNPKLNGEYSPAFEAAWSVYPKRVGGNSKKAAWDAWKARVNAGVSEIELASGIEGYTAYCEAAGIIATKYVKLGSTYFGPKEHYAEDWYAQAEQEKRNGGTNGKRFETAFDRLHRACADPAPGNGRGETIEGHAEILGADG